MPQLQGSEGGYFSESDRYLFFFTVGHNRSAYIPQFRLAAISDIVELL
jgi:hypothetical protein